MNDVDAACDVSGLHSRPLYITWWAARRSTGSSAYFAAGRSLTAWQNGVAVAGDYMSAASFLGIAGIIAFQGYDGFMYSVGWLVAYLTVLLVVAEPLRNAGKYTMADVLAYRLSPRPVRAMGALSTLTVSAFYMIAQMVGAGALVSLLLKDTGVTFHTAVIAVGALMIVYVVFGGMLATTWVQIVKAVLLMGGTILLSLLVLKHFGFSLRNFFAAVTQVTYHDAQGNVVTQNFLTPGLRYKPPCALDLISLGMALIFGTVACRTSWCVLHRARREDGAGQRGLGDADHRQFLHPDDLPRLRRGDDRRARFHSQERRDEYERAAVGANARRRPSSRSSPPSRSRRFWRSWPD